MEFGDVLVIRDFASDHIPVAARCSAVVVEAGLLPSAAVIVCRSLGIPCVIGVDGATSVIGDGSPVIVDGDAATIEIR